MPPPGQGIDLGGLTVVYHPYGLDPIQLLRNENPGCQAGWYFDEQRMLLVRCLQTCAELQADPRPRLELLFGCGQDIVLPD
jgi:hypothetical protein